MCKLYVMHLSHSTGGDDLRRLFAPYGLVRSAHVLSHLKTGFGTASGLVEMDSPECAKAAVAQLNGRTYHGRDLLVCPATRVHESSFGRMRRLAVADVFASGEPRTPRGPDQGGFGDRGGDRPRGGRLFVDADSDRPISDK